MSELDPVHEALERWSGPRPSRRRRRSIEVAGGDAPHRADGRRCRALSRRCSRPAAARQHGRRRRRRPPRGRSGGRRRASSPTKQAEVRARQPRDDEPVLRADEVRRRGRVQAARLLVPVDRLGERATSTRWSTRMNTAITGGANGIGVCLVDKKAFNAPTDAALKAKIPVVAYNADERPTRRLSYIGQDLFLSGQEMGKQIIDLVPSGDVALFIATPGRVEHPAAHRRRAGHDQEVRQAAIKTHVDRDRRGGAGRAVGDRRLRDRPSGHQGLLRRRRRQHAEPRADDPEARACAPRASRAAATTSRRSRRSCWPPTRSTSRSTSSPTCRASSRSCSCSCTRRPATLTGIADTNTGLKFLDKTTVVPVQQHEEPLRGHLVGGRRDQGRERPMTAPPDRRRPPGAGPSARAPAGPARGELAAALPDAARGQHHRRHGPGGDLLLAARRDHFFTHANFVKLLPYFAPFAILAVGEVLLMVARRDRPVDRVGLPVRAVHVLRVQPGRARPACRA